MNKDFDKVFLIDLQNEEQCEKAIKALNSATRRDILRLLESEPLGIWEIAQRLNIPLSTISEHVSILLRSGIISVIRKEDRRGQSKILARQYEQIEIRLTSTPKAPSKSTLCRTEIPIGSYTDFKIGKYCGMVGADGYLAERDNPLTFYSPKRHEAQLLWFDYGYLEYTIPLQREQEGALTALCLSMELCSEAPGYNESWRSDVFVEINGVPLGILALPGDFGARQGVLTPRWWNGCTQYGLLQKLEIKKGGTYQNGVLLSPVTLSDLEIEKDPLLKLRIGVKEDAKNRGGINLFGEKFGDHPQHILLDLIYKK